MASHNFPASPSGQSSAHFPSAPMGQRMASNVASPVPGGEAPSDTNEVSARVGGRLPSEGRA